MPLSSREPGLAESVLIGWNGTEDCVSGTYCAWKNDHYSVFCYPQVIEHETERRRPMYTDGRDELCNSC